MNCMQKKKKERENEVNQKEKRMLKFKLIPKKALAHIMKCFTCTICIL